MTRKLMHPFLHRTELVALGVSPDGRHLATGSFCGEDYDAGGDLLVWELATARVVNHFRISGGVGWPDYQGCIQWSPDGRTLAIAANTNGVQLFSPFELDGFVLDETYPTDGWSRPPSFTWAPDSKRVFISCWRSSYDEVTRQPTPPVEPPDVPGGVWTPGESMVWMEPGVPAGAWRGEPNDAGMGEQHIEPPKQLRWLADRVVGTGAHSQVLCIGMGDRRLRWLESAHGAVALDPRGRCVAVAKRGGVVLWDLDGRELVTLEVPSPAALAWSADGARLAVIEGAGPDTVALFDVAPDARSGRLLTRLAAAPKERGSWAGDFDPFAWGPRGEHVALLDADDRVQVWTVSSSPTCVATLELDDVRGLSWAPSERLIAWSPTALHFVDVAPVQVVTRALFATPPDDGPLTETVMASSQFPLGPKDARAWGARFEGGLIVPEGCEADADEVLGWSDGRSSAPLSSGEVDRFTSLAEALRAVPERFPLSVRDVLGGGGKPQGFAISQEPRELFDLWALIELEAAQAAESGDAWRTGWYAQLLGRLYHRAGRDDDALTAFTRGTQAHDQARGLLECALYCAMRRDLPRARRYRERVDAELLARANEETPSLAPQLDALRGALDTLLRAERARPSEAGDVPAQTKSLSSVREVTPSSTLQRDARAQAESVLGASEVTPLSAPQRDAQAESVSGASEVTATLQADARAELLSRERDAMSSAQRDARALIERAEAAIEPENNPGEKRSRVVLAWLAVGEVERALKLAEPLDARQRVALLRDVPQLGREVFTRLARASASAEQDFSALELTVDGFLHFDDWRGALDAIEWFDGLSGDQARVRVLADVVARSPAAAPALFEALDPSARLALVPLLAKVDLARAVEWAKQLPADSKGGVVALAAVGDFEGALALAKTLDEDAQFDAVMTALEVEPRGWAALSAFVQASCPEDEAEPSARLGAAAFRAGDLALAASARAKAVASLDLGQHWVVGNVAAKFAEVGDDEGAFVVLQRMPKAKRSYAIAPVAMAVATRLAKTPEHRGFAALYSLLAALPTDSLGTGGRAFETSRALRIIGAWPLAERDGLLD